MSRILFILAFLIAGCSVTVHHVHTHRVDQASIRKTKKELCEKEPVVAFLCSPKER
jgi:uncharacterized lipoprotein YmbA